MLDRFINRRFHIHPLFQAKIADCIPQLRVAHEENLRFKYLRLRLSQSPLDARLNLQQLLLGGGDSGIESLKFFLRLRLAHLSARHDRLLGAVTQQSAPLGKAGRGHFAQDHRWDGLRVIVGVHKVDGSAPRSVSLVIATCLYFISGDPG